MGIAFPPRLGWDGPTKIVSHGSGHLTTDVHHVSGACRWDLETTPARKQLRVQPPTASGWKTRPRLLQRPLLLYHVARELEIFLLGWRASDDRHARVNGHNLTRGSHGIAAPTHTSPQSTQRPQRKKNGTLSRRSPRPLRLESSAAVWPHRDFNERRLFLGVLGLHIFGIDDFFPTRFTLAGTGARLRRPGGRLVHDLR